MPRRNHPSRLGRAAHAVRAFATAPPEPAKLGAWGEGAAVSLGDTPAVVHGDSTPAANGRTIEGGSAGVGEPGEPWYVRLGFESEEDGLRGVAELRDRVRDLDSLRGRQGNEIGELRRQLDLYERLDDALLAVTDPARVRVLLGARRLVGKPGTADAVEGIVEREEHLREVAAGV